MIRRAVVPVAFVAAVALANQLHLGGTVPIVAASPETGSDEDDLDRRERPAPLTGLPAGDAAADRPALAVKIDGAPAAHPQVGLDVADVVYEEPVEGITRYVAVFHATPPDVVGPIRSVRPMDPSIVRPLHGLLAISGGIPAFVQAVGSSAQLFQEGSPGYFRERSRPAPHNLMARTADMFAAARSSEPPGALFAFLPDGDPFGGDPAVGVEVVFPGGVRASYAWDEAAGGWARSVNGRPHLAASGRQVVATNVVVQRVQTRATGFRGPGGGRVDEAVVVGEGEVLVLAGGRVVAGRWVRPDAASPARFVDASGAEIRLVPGRTWVELLPVAGSVAVAAPAPAPAPAPAEAPAEPPAVPDAPATPLR